MRQAKRSTRGAPSSQGLPGPPPCPWPPLRSLAVSVLPPPNAISPHCLSRCSQPSPDHPLRLHPLLQGTAVSSDLQMLGLSSRLPAVQLIPAAPLSPRPIPTCLMARNANFWVCLLV